MEVTKYLCEFFFTDIWHWLGLVILLGVFNPNLVSIIIDKSKKIVKQDEKDKDDKEE